MSSTFGGLERLDNGSGELVAAARGRRLGSVPRSLTRELVDCRAEIAGLRRDRARLEGEVARLRDELGASRSPRSAPAGTTARTDTVEEHVRGCPLLPTVHRRR